MLDDTPGLCDRCGLRWRLKELKSLEILGVQNNTLVCPDCWEASHPQLDTRTVRTDDKQAVIDSRSDIEERGTSRELIGSWDDMMSTGWR
jgi:hypothetical protein